MKARLKKRFMNIRKWFIRHHRNITIFGGLFILLYAGGFHYNPFNSFIIAVIDTLWLIVVASFFNWSVTKKPFGSKFANLIINIGFISLSIIIIVHIERFSIELLENKSLSNQNWIFPTFKNTILILGTFIGSLTHRYNRQQQQNEKLSLEKQEMELRLLRAQINPHFLFNSLNNIYSLVYTKNDNAPDAILKLAEMLRYITDGCQKDLVAIEKEIQYIVNYIDLQCLRSESKSSSNISFTHQITTAGIHIPPMILQPFVENCFKHGDWLSNPDGYIRVSITEKNNTLTYITENSKQEINFEEQKISEGIGIPNVEQRLKLHYKHKYQLAIIDLPGQYRTELTINLN